MLRHHDAPEGLRVGVGGCGKGGRGRAHLERPRPGRLPAVGVLGQGDPSQTCPGVEGPFSAAGVQAHGACGASEGGWLFPVLVSQAAKFGGEKSLCLILIMNLWSKHTRLCC